MKRNRLGACSSGQCSLQASICLAALFCNVVARTFIIGGDNEERENRALVRCIIPSGHGELPFLAFSGFRPTATRIRFCFCCSWLKASTFLPKEALISLSANSSPGGKRSRLPFTWHALPGRRGPSELRVHPARFDTPSPLSGPIAPSRIRN